MKPLDYLNLLYIWGKTYPGLLRVWRPGATGNEVRVSYGFDRVPGAEEHVFGGMVKLQDLNKAFEHCLEGPTILYLVSSALPYFPRRLVKLARRAGAKIVVNQNGVAYPGWYGKGYARANKSMRYLHSVADYVLYQSHFCKVSAEKFLGERVSGKGSEILYNPVDTNVFVPRENNGGSGEEISLLLAGSHWTTYRVFTALDTLKHLRELNAPARLQISGRFCWENDQKEAERQLFTYAEKLGVEQFTRYTGPYTQDEAPRLLCDNDILLHTKYNDPCPRLVVEAMACGLPVVYSDSGGVGELVGNDAGAGVKGPLDWNIDHPPAPDKLATCVLKITEDFENYSIRARKRAVELFDTTSWLNRHDEVFKFVLEN